MSYFTDMFGPSTNERRFLWEINRHGEIVIRRINLDGSAGSFVAERNPWEMVEQILQHVPGLIARVEWYGVASLPGGLQHWSDHFHPQSFIDVVAYLNQPGSLKNNRPSAAQRHVVEQAHEWPWKLFVTNGSLYYRGRWTGGVKGEQVWRRTDRGVAWDREHGFEQPVSAPAPTTAIGGSE